MISEATKVCSGPLCQGLEVRLSDFHRHIRSSDGLQPWCKRCCRHRRSAWAKTTVGKASLKKLKKTWQIRNPASSLLTNCKSRAKDKGLEFSLTLEWVKQRLKAGVCEVTGIDFLLGSLRHPFLPSIDRIDSSKGYTPENCRVVLWIINTAKHTLSEGDFQSALRQVAEAVVERV